MTEEENDANAALIASAPELLRQRDDAVEALKAIANYYDHALPDGDWTRTPMWGYMQQARAAIANAGKGDGK